MWRQAKMPRVECDRVLSPLQITVVHPSKALRVLTETHEEAIAWCEAFTRVWRQHNVGTTPVMSVPEPVSAVCNDFDANDEAARTKKLEDLFAQARTCTAPIVPIL